MDATPIELFTAALGTITAAGVLFLAYDVRALNRKFDRLEKALSGERVPNLDTVLRVVGALGLKLRAEAAPAVERQSG